MHKLGKRSIVLLLAAALLIAPFATTGALAQIEIETKEPSAGAMTYDLFIMRPFGLVATVIGAGVFVIALPITAITGTVDLASRKMVVDPFNFTVIRPLGTW